MHNRRVEPLRSRSQLETNMASNDEDEGLELNTAEESSANVEDGRFIDV